MDKLVCLWLAINPGFRTPHRVVPNLMGMVIQISLLEINVVAKDQKT